MSKKLMQALLDALMSKRDTVNQMRLNALEYDDDKRADKYDTVVDTLAEIIDALDEVIEHA